MNRATTFFLTLILSTLTFSSFAAQPSNAQDVASELSRKAHEGGQPHCTTVEASAYSKLSARTDYIN